MPGSLLLIEGPPGGGKSREARRLLREDLADIIADFTLIWAALRAIGRDEDGKFPVRTNADPAVSTGLVSYVQATVARQSLRAGLRTIVTTARRRQEDRWRLIAQQFDAPFSKQTLEAEYSELVRRLSDAQGNLSVDCQQALARWFSS